VRSLSGNIPSYQAVVEFHEQLLSSQLDRLKVGRLDSRTVLETEEKLFEARIAALDNLVQYQKAFLELELVTGSILAVRDLDLTKPQLQARTAAYLEGKLSMVALEKYAQEAAKEYYEDLSPASYTSRKALEALREEMSAQDLENQRKALELLRREVQEADGPSSETREAPRGPSGAGHHERALELLRDQMRRAGQAPQR
jgi:hypothetical protein